MADKEEPETEVAEDELSKEARLEAARKKFEDLKKKKKKGKKKKKDDDEKDESPVPDADGANETKVAEVAEFEKPKEKDNTSPKKEDETSESLLSTNSTNDLANDRRPASETNPAIPATTSVSSEVSELKKIVEQQKSTINKLRDELTDLKLDRMDLKDKIMELEKKLSNSTVVAEVPKYVPAKPVITSNKFASASHEDINAVNTDDFRERLLAWKGWQVDMTRWTSGQKLAL